MTIYDKIGQPIVPGCIVGYVYSYYNFSVGMKIAKVLSISKRAVEDTVAYEIEVHSIEDRVLPIRLCGGPVILKFPDKMIVIPQEKIPGDYRDLLNEV